MDGNGDDLDDFDSDWRPRRVARATSILLGDEAKEITVRTFRTQKPFDKAVLLAGMRRGKLTDTSPFGMVHLLSTDEDDDVRVVLARQGETRLRRYEPDAEEVEWWTMPRTLLDVVAIRYKQDEAGNLYFTMFGGGGIPENLIEWFHAEFAEIARNEPIPDALDPDLVRARCFDDRFLQRLYSIQAQIDAEGYQTIDHTRFKSRNHIDPDCERLKEFRAAETLLIEAFESEVDLASPDLDDEVCIRFTVRTAPGTVRLTVPRLRFRKTAKDLSAITRAFYDVCERAVAAIVGAEIAAVANIDPGAGRGPLLGRIPDLDLKPYVLYLKHTAQLAGWLRGLDLGPLHGEWIPHLRALEEMLAGSEPPAELGRLLGQLANDDPELTIRLLSAVQDLRLHRVGELVLGAVQNRMATLPRPLLPLADAELLRWGLATPDVEWRYLSDDDAVEVFGIPFAGAKLGSALFAQALIRCAQTEHRRLLTLAPDARRVTGVHQVLARLAAIPDVDLPAAQALRSSLVAGNPGIVTMLLGAGTADDDDAAGRVLGLFGLPLWPVLAVGGKKTERVIRNVGFGAALRTAVGLLSPGDIPAGGTAPLADGAHRQPISFQRFGARWQFDPEAPADDGPSHHAALTPMVARKKLLEFRAAADPQNTLRGESPALLHAVQEAFLAHVRNPRPHVIIEGETGTGKTELARMLHRAACDGDPSGARRTREAPPFVRVTASSFGDGGDENIMRGELIGYGKDHGIPGIPNKGKKGHLQLAADGVLFVDDFEALPKKVQHVLLDALAGEPVSAVGGEMVPVRCRVFLATNAGVDSLVKDGVLRADLVARVGARVSLPPLRDRKADIFAIVEIDAGTRLGLTDRAWCALLRHDWPRNIRELRSTLADADAFARAADDTAIDVGHLRGLPEELLAGVAALPPKAATREVWRLAAEFASAEGFEKGVHGAGLQKRLTAIFGCSAATASRNYKLHIATNVADAPSTSPTP